MKWLIYLVLFLGAGAAGYIRFAPSDLTKWHIDPAEALASLPPLAEGEVTVVPAGAALLLQGDETGPELLARLDAIALANPRTKPLAGSAAEGRITWVTRSKVWGFPDYATAQTYEDQGSTRMVIFSRQRFGSLDWGVNSTRLRAWAAALDR